MKRFLWATSILILTLSSISANNNTNLQISVNQPETMMNNGDRLLYFTNTELFENSYVKVNDTLFVSQADASKEETIWWIPFYLVNDTILIKESDMADIPTMEDNLIWVFQYAKKRIVICKCSSTKWGKDHAIPLRTATASIVQSNQSAKKSVSKATLLLVLFSCLGLLEGFFCITLLLKLCRKNKVVSKRSRNNKTCKVRQLYTLLKKLDVRSIQDANKKLDILAIDSECLNQLLTDPSQFKGDERFASINKIYENLDKTLEEKKIIQSKLNDLLNDCTNLTNRPSIILKNKNLSASELYKIVHDWQLLTSQGNSGKSFDFNQLKSTELKNFLKPYMGSADIVSTFMRFKPYFENIKESIKDNFYAMPNHSEKENFQTLLLYLSQFYSTTMVLLYVMRKNSIDPNDKNIAPHTANMQPFFQKEANIEDINAVKNKGAEFLISGNESIIKRIEFLKQYEPLDFNLVGDYYQPRLKQ